MSDEKIWTIEELKKVSDSLEDKTPQDILRWVVENFNREDFALACSFGEPVLLDMLVKIKPDARIFYIDTGLHFKETIELKDRIEAKYGITIERLTPEQTLEEMAGDYGPELWERNPDLCCNIRKVQPLREILSTLKAWITGIRRDQSPTRRDAPVVGFDIKHGLVKVNPLVNWTAKDVWMYMQENDVPYNKLLDQAYTSIGCEPCTRPIRPGEDERAGRWAGHNKTECGLHK